MFLVTNASMNMDSPKFARRIKKDEYIRIVEWTGNFAVIIKDIRSHRLQYFSEYFFRLEFSIIHNLSKVLLIFSARNF